MMRRIAAATIDGCVVIALTLALAPSTGAYFLARTVPTLHVGSPHTVWRGGIPLVLAFFGRFVYGVPLAASLVLLAEPLFGTSAGKSALGLAVVRFRSQPRGDVAGERAGAAAGAIRYLAKASGPLVLVAALLAGWWPLAVLSVALAATTLVGLLPILLGRRALHDVLAGTNVIRREPAPG